MLWALRTKGIVAGMLVGLTGVAGSLGVDANENPFYRAYYLEQTEADYGTAAKLYGAIVADRDAPAEVVDWPPIRRGQLEHLHLG